VVGLDFFHLLTNGMDSRKNLADAGITRGRLLVCPNAEAVANSAAELFVKLAARAVVERGRFRTALSGGSTPRRTYELLATPHWRSQVAWEKVDIFWGDERYVPPDDPESNYRMVQDALLQHVPVPAGNVHRVPTELAPEAATKTYEEEIRRSFGVTSSIPEFDLIFLGLGTNGHTASLFPGSPLLHETSRLVAAEFVAEAKMWRLTVTLPLLNQGQTVAFLVAGEGKADILREVLTGAFDPDRLPAQLVRPEKGELLWIVDQAAARQF
jgi:6-phosphogluconolactonase